MKIRRILLVSPPAYTFKTYRDINPLPPMGLGYLASVAEKLGIEVKILDCLVEGWDIEEEVNDRLIRVGISDEAIKAHIEDFDPDIVGINCQFSRQHRIYHQLLSLIKEIRPDCFTIAGGPHVTVCPDDIINDLNCDFAIVGEAEESFRDLLICLFNDSDFSHIDGLCWKIDGKAYLNKKYKWISDLDSIPFPAFHLMHLEAYFGLEGSHGLRHREKFMPIMTSRGCPAKCTFCSAKRVWGNKFRVRSVENVIEEMKLLRSEYGVEEIMFEDDNVTANCIRAKKLFLRMIEENFGFIWDTPNGVGVWSIDEEILDLMKESGCVILNFPVESGSQEVLDNIIKKPLKLSKIPRLIEHCRKIKLDYGMFLVIGMPGEKIEDMWKSFRFVADCGCLAPHISVATPYPGTELFDICMEDNLFTKEFSLDDLFIRSFMIETPDWDEHMLRKTLLKGKIYLNYRKFTSDPMSILDTFIRVVKMPRYYLSLIKDLIR